MKRLFSAITCVLFCLILLGGTACADMGPKESLTITVINAPEGVYYLDLLQQDEDGAPNVDPEDYDHALVEGLRSWEGEDWYPALVHGTYPPLFGDLVPGEDGTHHFSYFGLPKTFRIAVSSADGGPGHGGALYPGRCSTPNWCTTTRATLLPAPPPR